MTLKQRFSYLGDGYAPHSLGTPGLIYHTDLSVFKQTKEQKLDAQAAKNKHKLILLKYYKGKVPKGVLNIPSKQQETIKLTL